MAEVYVGTKFRTLMAGHEPPGDERLPELAGWCHRFAQLGLTAGGAGNLSIRSARGFLISRTAADLSAITPADFVEVVNVDFARAEVVASGAYEPSSESLMHAAIYGARPDVNAVFHGHADELLRAAPRLGIAVTEREQPYGTPELAAEVQKLLAGNDFFALRGHGLVSLGRTMAEAGRRMEAALARV